MDEDFIVFIIVLTLIAGGIFLIFTKMILNFFRDRRKSKGDALDADELERMIQRAVEAGTLSLHDRLDDLEQKLEGVGEKVEARPKALPEAQPSVISPHEEEAVALLVNGFVREVLQELPMEFAVEAQSLLKVSLEGSVG